MFLIGPSLEEIGLFCVYWDCAEQKIFSKVHVGKFFWLFFKAYMPLNLLIIVFPKFDQLTEWGMALYLKMSQNVNIYLA
jgi:hypothetical protein